MRDLSGPSWDETVLLDRTHLRTYTGGDGELIAELLVIFAENAPDYLEALKGVDLPDWRDAAHKLKGAARAIGAWNLACEAERAEHAPPESDATRRAYLTELDVRLERLLAKIGEIVEIE